MGLFQDIFRTKSTQIDSPVLGVLDLMSGEAEPEIESDSRALFHYFPLWKTSRKKPQSCDILMLYARVNRDGSIDGSVQTLREIIRSCGATVVIIATDNPPDHYFEAVDETGYGQANLVQAGRPVENLAGDMLRESPLSLTLCVQFRRRVRDAFCL